VRDDTAAIHHRLRVLLGVLDEIDELLMNTPGGARGWLVKRGKNEMFLRDGFVKMA